MKLSICIPTYGRTNSLLNLLSHIKENIPSNENIEVIVAENYSDDLNRQRLVSKVNSFSFARFIFHSHNLGLAGNYYFLLKESNGDLIWILGDDDIPSNNFFCELFRLIKHNHKINHILIPEKSIRPNLFSKNWSVPINLNQILKENSSLSGKLMSNLMHISSNIISSKRRNLLLNKLDINYCDIGCENLADPLYFSGASVFLNEDVYLLDKVSLSTNKQIKNSWSAKRFLVTTVYMPRIIIKLTKFFGSKELGRKMIISHYSEKRYLLKFFVKTKFWKNMDLIRFIGYKNSFVTIIKTIRPLNPDD